MSDARKSSYVCDTIPAPRLAAAGSSSVNQASTAESTSHFEPSREDVALAHEPEHHRAVVEPVVPSPAPPRKLCVRHQRMADEGTNLKLQQSLDALPLEEREAVNAVWSNFSSSSHPRRALILQGLLTMCCFSQLSLLTEQLAHLIRIDPFSVLPGEVSLKILGHLDATSLCRAAQVNKQWRTLADDDILWRGICEQHIGQKCLKCGWGLPVLERRRTRKANSASPHAPPSPLPSLKRELDQESLVPSERPLKRQRSEQGESAHTDSDSPSASQSIPPSPSESLLAPNPPHTSPELYTRPWKDVYSERLTVERNWRRGRCSVRTLKGHTDGVMCLQFSETLSHPSFPILITGSYDRTARVWNLETGQEVLALKGHTRAVRALQFDEAKLITGSMDHTIRVWNWRTGRCIRTLEGHTEGVVALNFDSNVLASGSVDATVKVWNFRTGEAFTLRGHQDWVNSVQLWDSDPAVTRTASSSTPMFDAVPSGNASPSANSAPHIDPGKMLFSASDDGTIKLWDLTLRACVRQFTGHVGQVQTMRLLAVDEGCGEPPVEGQQQDAEAAVAKRPTPVLISGSLDNTIKLWDIATGKTIRTLFGHIEGVWGVASDKLRLVSGSHDRTIKVWSRDEGRCTATLVGHRGAVTCLALGEDKIVSGSDDGDIRVWSFAGDGS
ncbi:hypothetical protein PLICRDRAFT_141328 [Plicaturopsis crispa FD-325 SS-3]|nr:hypothetical protein PLICRDRAFT_141328 [Plicaturopsis crispa FD-325 SS-3]